MNSQATSLPLVLLGVAGLRLQKRLKKVAEGEKRYYEGHHDHPKKSGSLPEHRSPGDAGGAFAQTKPLEMKWSELSPLIGGHHVGIQLTDGLTVKGEVVAVREDAILVDVSSSVRGYPKGSGSIPRASITLIDLDRSRGAWGRTLGTVIGSLGGMTLGGYVLATENTSAGPGLATFIGIAAAGSLAGFYTGRAVDKRVTHIRIAP